MATAPSVVAISRHKSPPQSLPFIPARMADAGLWAAYTDPAIITKIGESTTQSTDSAWEDTGFFVHLRGGDGQWTSRPLHEAPGGKAAALAVGTGHFTLHAGFWKSLQASRPAKAATAAAATATAKTGSFTVTLAERNGPPCTPNDPKENPFIDFKGDPAAESASVVVPASYDGSQPYGLMVYISPGQAPENNLSKKWQEELEARKYIWIGPHNAGNNNPGDRRVWMAQQCRAWALHHYRIDPAKTIISGFSNGGDSASATAVSTPYGFSSALLMAPPSLPPIGPVIVPQETPRGQIMIQPLSKTGISHIKKNLRVAYICGSNDSFITNVKSSTKALEDELKLGCKLFELQGHGHGAAPSIAEAIDFLDGPRASADPVATAGGIQQSSAALREVQAAMGNRPQAKAKLARLWETRPDLRTSADVTTLIEKLEALP